MTAAIAGRAAASSAAGGSTAAAGSTAARSASTTAASSTPTKAAPAKKAAPSTPDPPAGGGGGGGKQRDSGIGKAFGKLKGKGSMSRALVAEFIICMLILGLSPLSKPAGEAKPADFMKSGTAMAGVFIVLGLISAIGPKASRAAAAFGGLVTLALVIDQRSIFGVMVDRLKAPGYGGSDEPEGAEPPPVTPEKPDEPAAPPVRPPSDFMPERDR